MLTPLVSARLDNRFEQQAVVKGVGGADRGNQHWGGSMHLLTEVGLRLSYFGLNPSHG